MRTFGRAYVEGLLCVCHSQLRKVVGDDVGPVSGPRRGTRGGLPPSRTPGSPSTHVLSRRPHCSAPFRFVCHGALHGVWSCTLKVPLATRRTGPGVPRAVPTVDPSAPSLSVSFTIDPGPKGRDESLSWMSRSGTLHVKSSCVPSRTQV